MNYVTKDDKGEALIAVEVNGVTFTALDVAYTISQNYQRVLIGDTVYLNEDFPTSCTPLELSDNSRDVVGAISNSYANFYFDADGIFVFRYETDPNPDRAATEFVALVHCKHVILAPSMTKYDFEADEILVKERPGANKCVYMYRNLK